MSAHNSNETPVGKNEKSTDQTLCSCDASGSNVGHKERCQDLSEEASWERDNRDTTATGKQQPHQQERLHVQTQDEDQPDQPRVYSVFSSRTKVFLVLVTVFGTLFSPFSSFIYLPAIDPIAKSYHRPLAEINLTVTLYQVMQAISPLFFGDLSDQLGRRPVYVMTFIIYIAANIGLALQNNYAALMVLRALQSTGSSATVAIGSAVMADVTTSAERGGYITAVQIGTMFAPALAPVLGGILTQFLGWRSNFWFLTIGAGLFLLIYVPFVPEVCSRFARSLPPREFADADNAYRALATL